MGEGQSYFWEVAKHFGVSDDTVLFLVPITAASNGSAGLSPLGPCVIYLLLA